MTTLWDTTGTAVVKALSAERRSAGSVASGLALTLVVVVDEQRVTEAEQAATRAAAQHPCRLLVVVRRRPDAPEPRLDAEVLIGGRLGQGEAVVMRMYGRLALHAESVVLPLLAPDVPVVTWWFGEPPRLIGHDPLGVFADRRITDTNMAPDTAVALRQRGQDYTPGDTDLSWTRTTLWRGLCASAFDAPTAPVAQLQISGEAGSPSRALMAGWLHSRLGLAPTLVDSDGPGLTGVRFALADGGLIELSRRDPRTAVLTRTGQADRTMPLPRRELGDLLAEELRRLDADQAYADALGSASGVTGLTRRPSRRRHVWRDPATPGADQPKPEQARPEQPSPEQPGPGQPSPEQPAP